MERSFYHYIRIALIVAIISSLSFLAITNYYGFTKVRDEYDFLRGQFGDASRMLYGVVESANYIDRTLIVRMPNLFDPTGNPRTVVVHVPTDAIVARSELQGTNGVYDHLSERQPTTLEEVPVGAYVGMLIRRPTEILEANILLFGNPL